MRKVSGHVSDRVCSLRITLCGQEFTRRYVIGGRMVVDGSAKLTPDLEKFGADTPIGDFVKFAIAASKSPSTALQVAS